MNLKYNLARERILTGQVNWLTATVRTLLVAPNYVPDADDSFVSDIPTSAIVIRGPALAAKTATHGYARSTPTRYGDLSLNAVVQGIVFYIDTGSDATSLLLAYCDDEPAFPFTPAGLNYDFGWDVIEGGFFRT